MTTRGQSKLTVPQYLTFAETMEGIISGLDFDPNDPRNQVTVAIHERMTREGAFGTPKQRRAWARRCRKKGGV